ADRELAEAQAALNQARAGRTASQTMAAREVVRATFNGIVAKRWHNPGDLVEPSATDPILRIIDPNRLQVAAAVPIADVPRILIGAAAFLAVTVDPKIVTLRFASWTAVIQAVDATIC